MKRYEISRYTEENYLKFNTELVNDEPTRSLVSNKLGETIAIIDEVNANHIDILRLNKLNPDIFGELIQYTKTPIAER